jgi:hypothetical protein
VRDYLHDGFAAFVARLAACRVILCRHRQTTSAVLRRVLTPKCEKIKLSKTSIETFSKMRGNRARETTRFFSTPKTATNFS